MGYRKFKHKEIDYKLFFGLHLRSSYPMIKESGGLKNLDILVMENSGQDFSKFIEHTQYQEIFENIPKENPNLLIYGVDFNLKIKDTIIEISSQAMGYITVGFGGTKMIKSSIKSNPNSRRDFIKNSLRLWGGLALVLMPLTKFTEIVTAFSEEKPYFGNYNNPYEMIVSSKLNDLRNALVPEIIEKGILPYEKTSNPKIGILYGSSHFEIEKMFKNQKLRNRTLKIHNKFISENLENFNCIQKMSLAGEEFKFEEVKTNVF